MRTTRSGSVSNRGVVTEIDVNQPDRAKTDTCPRYFRRVLKLIKRSSTFMNSMIHDHIQNARFGSISAFVILILLSIKISFNHDIK